MPYTGEHAAPQYPSERYLRIKKKKNAFGPGIHANYGFLKGGGSEVQSVHFDSDKFTVAQAKAWLKAHEYKTEVEPATKESSALLVGGDREPMRAASEVLARDGIPMRRYVKDIVTPGLYTHPMAGWRYDVTPERIMSLAGAFKRMAGAGVPVKFTKDHGQKSEDALGEVLDAWVEGGRLYALIEARGEDAIRLCERVDHVSPEIVQDYRDPKGAAYGDAVVAVSVTPDPMFTGQEPFKIAASQSAVPVLCFAAHGVTDMAMFDELKELLGGDDAITEENAVKRLKDRFKALDAAKAEAEKKLSALTGEVEALKRKFGDGGSDGKGEPEPDGELMDERSRRIRDRIAASVKTGHVKPAVADRLRQLFVDKANPRRVLMLSTQASRTEEPLADTFLDLIEANGPVLEFGQKAGRQTLDRKCMDPDAGEAKSQAATTSRMVTQAYGK